MNDQIHISYKEKIKFKENTALLDKEGLTAVYYIIMFK